MTLTQIILLDLEHTRREKGVEHGTMTLKEYDRAVRRRLWKKRLSAVGEVVGAIAFVAGIVTFCALCCIVSDYHWN